ncbi:hypothetical protein ACH5RR_008836 [Cinchona calisaya]|uniref:Uncharacterized protein n=1 Tax=Cinchona calisaya TaxID=153742 RepID=A0ABD3ACQ6_9GENT
MGEKDGLIKKDYPSQSCAQVPQTIKERSEQYNSQLDQSFENKILLEVTNVGHRGHWKEKKIPTSEGRPYFPSGGTIVADGSTYANNADAQNKQHLLSDINRGRNQNNYHSTSRESCWDWHHEWQRHNIHYEYHPIGSYNSSKLEKPEDGSHNGGQKDKGQGLSKHSKGNFHWRQSGNISVDTGSG